jgi:membrane protein YqaA with SNARE-associated domain
MAGDTGAPPPDAGPELTAEPAVRGAGVDATAVGSTTRWRNPVRVLYDWVLSWADRPSGPWALSAFAFAESSFFPIPPDVLLIPLCLSMPSRALWFATLSTVFSVLGGMFGYLLGAVAFDLIGRPILDFYGLMDGFARLQEWYQTYDAWAVGVAGFTPIPYKVFTVTAGFVKLNFPVFVVASTIGRGGRFFLVAILLRLFGEPMKEFIDRYFNWLTLVVAVLFVGGFIVLRYGFQ